MLHERTFDKLKKSDDPYRYHERIHLRRGYKQRDVFTKHSFWNHDARPTPRDEHKRPIPENCPGVLPLFLVWDNLDPVHNWTLEQNRPQEILRGMPRGDEASKLFDIASLLNPPCHASVSKEQIADSIALVKQTRRCALDLVLCATAA
jgi:hypothetical protein